MDIRSVPDNYSSAKAKNFEYRFMNSMRSINIKWSRTRTQTSPRSPNRCSISRTIILDEEPLAVVQRDTYNVNSMKESSRNAAITEAKLRLTPTLLAKATAYISGLLSADRRLLIVCL
ncbi:hypothetical protein RRG08_057763 [Elysia crispata]|uniref:Uncharacterized protein n=1 Tax=Elysia crispata TaxID=231223 RepID=A0AAE1A172_9GAST|nr:hypothetical protein RRG08_057763 [Elysia crispata]